MNTLPFQSGLLAIQLMAMPLLFPSLTHAQSVNENNELPVCNAVASDADGDGFGWELFNSSRWNGEYRSCRVTTESVPAPDITNRETGARVNLIRAYWDANKDIADRRVRCEYFQFNQSTATYEKNDRAINDATLWHLKDTLYLHEPLSNELPRMSTMYRFPVDQLPVNTSVSDINTSHPIWEQYISGMLPLWTVNDGIYYGASPLRLSPYMEIIDHGSGNANAVRIWTKEGETTENTADDFYACHALDDNALIPTGAPGATTDSFITLDNNVIVSMPYSEPATSDYINKETGQLVEFTDGRWNYNSQIAMRNFRCVEHQWEWRQPSIYGAIDLDDSLAGWNTLFHPYTGGDTVWVSRQSYTSRDRPSRDWTTTKVSIESGKLGQWTTYEPNYSGWELLENEFRLWNVEDNNLFHECSVGQLTQLPNEIGFFRSDEAFTPVSMVDGAENVGTEKPVTNGEESPDTTETLSGGGGVVNVTLLMLLLLFVTGRSRNIRLCHNREY